MPRSTTATAFNSPQKSFFPSDKMTNDTGTDANILRTQKRCEIRSKSCYSVTTSNRFSILQEVDSSFPTRHSSGFEANNLQSNPATNEFSTQKVQVVNKWKKLENTKSTSKGNILLVADSHGRGLSGRLRDRAIKRWNTSGTVMPGAKLKNVIEPCLTNKDKFTKKDVVVIMGAANDIACNEAAGAVSTLRSTLPLLNHTNVIVVNVPHRHDLIESSCVNAEIRKYNDKLENLCSRYDNVKLLDANNLTRSMHTRHGLHLNSKGKDYISENLYTLAGTFSHIQIPIPLTYNNSKVRNSFLR